MKINLGGKYYEVDVTWDDPVSYSDSLDSPGRITHRYFLFSDGAFQNHYGYSSVNPSNDTTFDEYTLHNMKSQFCMVNGRSAAIARLALEPSPTILSSFATV